MSHGITIRRLTAAAVAAAGLLILFYPNISDAWNQKRASELATEYEQSVASLEDTEVEKILADARIYNKALVGSQVPAAFLEHERKPDPEYEKQLNPTGTGMMGEVEIPCINVRIPVRHYADDLSLERGAGHLPGSSLPVGGDSTHSVITAHRGLQEMRLFTDLDRVREGNLFYLRILGDTMAYEVDQILTVEPTETSSLAITAGKDQCTLVTCTPYALNTHRLLVRGHRVPYETTEYEEESAYTAPPSLVSVRNRIICAAVGVLLAFVLELSIRSIRNRFIKAAEEEKE